MATAMSSLVGQTLGHGRYHVKQKLGEGGMAIVFLARDGNLGIDVVLKVPKPIILADPQFADRFKREIRSMLKLAHPHIVKIRDVGEHQGVPFYVMELLTGGNLQDRCRVAADGSRIPMTPERLGSWLAAVADALDFIHRQGFVHRDIKPGNILFDAHGNAFVSDFGVVKVISDGSSKKNQTVMTQAGMVLGTGPYMAPEVTLGENCDGRVDQYALAATVYEMLCGRLPFDGKTIQAILLKQISGEMTPLHELNAKVPKTVSQAVQRALSRDQRNRFATCTAFAQAVLGAARIAQGGSTSGVDLDKRAQITCPGCGKKFRMPESVENKRLRCPACKSVIPFPGAKAERGAAARMEHARETRSDNQVRDTDPATTTQQTGRRKPRFRVFRFLALLLLTLTAIAVAAAGVLVGLPAYRERNARLAAAKGIDVPPPGDIDKPAPAPNSAPQNLDKGFRALERDEPEVAFAAFHAVLQGTEKREEAYFGRGRAYLQKRDHVSAMKDFDEALKLKKNYPLARAYRAEAWIAQRDFSEAIADCDAALQEEKRLAVAFAHRGRARARQCAYDLALLDCDEALRLDANLVAAYLDRAWVRHQRTFLIREKGDIDRARADCDAALKRKPKLAAAYAMRALVEWGKGNYQSALADCKQATDIDAKLALAHAVRGRALVELKKFDEALEACQRAVDLDPQLGIAYDFRGDVFLAKRDYPRAIQDYKEFARLEPKNAIAADDLGRAYYEMALATPLLAGANLATSVDHFTKAVTLEPRFASAYLGRGQALQKRAKSTEALADFNKALEIDRDYADAYFARGEFHRSRFSNDLAIKDYDEAIRLMPGTALFHARRGKVHFYKFNDAAAIQDFTDAIRLRPDDASFFIDRADLYFAQAKYDSAITDYSGAISLQPLNGSYRNMRGNAYYRKKQYDPAIEDYTEAMRLEPKNANFVSNRGSAYYEKKLYGNGVSDFTKALNLRPGNVGDLACRGHCYYYLRSYESARADYTEVIRINKSYSPAYNGLGNIHLDQKEYLVAVDYYTKALQISPNDPQILQNRGDAYALLGEKAKADADFAKANKLKKK